MDLFKFKSVIYKEDKVKHDRIAYEWTVKYAQ